MSTVDLATLTPDHFKPFVGGDFFMVLADGERLPVQLRKIRESTHRMPRGFRQPFAVEFASSAPGKVHPQGTYRLEHESLGSLELFLCPVQSNEAGCLCEAVFG